MKRRIIIAMAMFSLLAGTSLAQTALEGDFSKDISADKDWHFLITPYLWFAGINGDMTLGSHEVNFNVPFKDIFNNLKFGVMATEEVRKGRIVFLSDQLYLQVGTQKVKEVAGFPQELTVNASNNTFYWDNEIGYRGVATDRFNLDALVGIQYWYVDTSLSANPPLTDSGVHSQSVGFVNPVLAMRAQVKIYKNLGGFVKGDIGGYGAGSDLTGQALAGIGFPVKKIGLDFGYRRLYLDQTHKQLSQQITLQGLFLGVTFGIK
ncbi:MAG: hypothetical protein WBW33_07055 [Bryobacteraceae bacterium]